MNAEELIELLSKLSPDNRSLPIMIEGCDCIGNAKSIMVAESRKLGPRQGYRKIPGYVLIQRKPD